MTDSIPRDEAGIEVTGDRFAVLPETVLYAPISDRAVRVYAVLQRHTNMEAGAIPGRKRLAKMCNGCSLSSLDRAIRELIAHHLLRIEHRYRDGTRELTSSRYHLLPRTVTSDSTSRHPRRQVASPVTQERELPRERDPGSGRSTRSRARPSSPQKPIAADVMKVQIERAKRDLRGA